MAAGISVVLRVVSDQDIQCADRSDGATRDLLFADALSCHRSHFHFLLRCRGFLSGTQGHAGASRRNYPGRVVTEIALQTVKLVRRVQGVVTHTLVDGIDLSVAKGEFLAITGPSGSGKSSLLYLLGLLDAPTEGEVIICGQATSKLSETERADVRLTKCGFVFQFHFLLPEFTALENVLLPMRAYGRMSTKDMNERAMSLLTSLGLGDQTGKRPNQLSGGQRQRVALARRLPTVPKSLSPTSRPEISTPLRPRRCSESCATSPTAARPWWLSPTMRHWPRGPTGASISSTARSTRRHLAATGSPRLRQ